MKNILYDWFGLNGWLFLTINGWYGAWYDDAMLFITWFGDHHNFKYYVVATVLVVGSRLLLRKSREEKIEKADIKAAAALIITMVMGFAFCALIIGLMKSVLAMPRPFVVYRDPEFALHFAGPYPNFADYNASLPSGHAATIAFIVAVLWPVIPAWAQKLGLLMVGLVCWSRIAVGMHFPADVIVGALIGAVSAIFVGRYVYRMLGVKRDAPL